MGRLTALPTRFGMAPRRVGYTPDQAKGPPPVQSSYPWKAWYKTKRWRDLRLSVFARDRYACQMCGRLEGNTSLLVCDHRKAHRGNEALFWSVANLQTMCAPCHNGAKQLQEQESLHTRGIWD